MNREIQPQYMYSVQYVTTGNNGYLDKFVSAEQYFLKINRWFTLEGQTWIGYRDWINTAIDLMFV